MKTIYVAGRLIRQIAGDKRTLALILLAPIMILFLLKTVLTSAPTKPNFDVINMPTALRQILAQKAVVTISNSENNSINRIKSGKIDGYVVFSGMNQHLVVEGSNPTTTSLCTGVYNGFLSQYVQNTVKSALKIPIFPNLTITKYYASSSDFQFFDYIAPLLMGFMIFFLVFLLSGISFLRERISGTMERLMATSIKRSNVVLGYFLGFGFFAVIQTIVIQSFLFWVLNIKAQGPFGDILVINVLIAAGSLSLGTLLSAFASNEFQLFQFIPIIIIPQILFCGLFPMNQAPTWLLYLSKAFPLTYAADALKNVMLKGYGLDKCVFDLLILAGFALVFLFLNIIALRKYRKI